MSKKIVVLVALIGALFATSGYCVMWGVEQGETFKVNNSSFIIKKIAVKEEIHLQTNDKQIQKSDLKQLAENIQNQIKARSGQKTAVECETEDKNLVECECTPLS